MDNINQYSDTDIYLLDQIFKNRFQKDDIILDAGCGSGRNLTWFVNNDITIHACDSNIDAIKMAQERLGLPAEFFKQSVLEDLKYPDEKFDGIICSAVLHFAKSTDHFSAMFAELIRVLKPGGILFIRMTSTFGLPNNYIPKSEGRYLLQDGSERFLLTKTLLEDTLIKHQLTKIEPVKSVLVEELRSMTTLVLRK